MLKKEDILKIIEAKNYYIETISDDPSPSVQMDIYGVECQVDLLEWLMEKYYRED